MKKQFNIRRLIILAVIILIASAYSTIASTLEAGVFTNVNINPDPIKLGQSASIQYTLSENSTVSIAVYKDDGSTTPVRNLLTNSNKSAGSLSQSWDGKDNNGVLVPDGRYRIYLEAKTGETVKGQVEKIVMAARSPVVSGLTDTPDPFNPLNNEQATINYTISTDAIVSVTILKGTTPVRNLTPQEVKPAGTYTINWDGKDDAGQYVGDGVYNYQVDAVSPTVAAFKGTAKSTTTLEKDTPVITGISATPDPLKLGVNSLSIGYTLSENAKVTVKVLDSKGNLVKLVADNISKNSGSNTASWNGQDALGNYVPEGVYTVEVSAVDNFGKPSAVVNKSVTAGFLPAISGITDTPDPFNGAAGEKSTITYTISKDALVTVAIYKGTTMVVKTLENNVLKEPGTYTIQWDGKTADGSALAADGNYTYQIDAVSPTVAAFKSTSKGTTVLESSNPEITGLTISPDPLKLAVNNLTIGYTLSEDAKVTVKILDNNGQAIQTIQETISKKMGYNTATWNGKDPAGNYVPEGIYTVSVAAVDSFDKPASAQTKTGLAGYLPTVSGATVTGSPFNANPPAEGPGEKATINYSIAYPAKVTVNILKSSTIIRTLAAGVNLPAGPQTITWDGKDNSGAIVGDGDYSYQIDAVSPTVDAFKSTVKGTVTVEGNDPSVTDVSILPNPVKVGYSASIRYNLSEAANVTVTIRNDMGIVRSFSNINKTSAGSYNLSWDSKDDSGNLLAAGNYTLDVIATDKFGKSGSGMLLFQVGTTPIISDLALTPASIDASLSQKANISYNVSTDSTITISIYDSKNVLWNTIYRNVNGTDTVVWDGSGSAGNYKVDTFTITINAVSAVGNFTAKPVSGTVSVTKVPYSSLSCKDCHVTYPQQHPMANCVACHGNDVDSSGGGHSYTAIATKNCSTCHNAQNPHIPGHPPDIDGIHITENDMTNCSECHNSSLIIEHTSRFNRSTNTPYDCNTCHNSTKTAVRTAIDNGDTKCFSCHEKAEHTLYHSTYIGQDCKTCHDKTNPTIDTVNIATVHTERGMKCETCHNSTQKNIQDAINWGLRACSNCHTAAHGQTLTSSVPGIIPQYTSLNTTLEWLNPIALEFWAGESWVPSDVNNGYLVMTKRYSNLLSDEVFNFYKNKMLELGWQKVSGPDTATDKFELVYTKEGKKAYIRFYNSERYNTTPPLDGGYRIEILYK